MVMARHEGNEGFEMNMRYGKSVPGFVLFVLFVVKKQSRYSSGEVG